MDKVIAAWNSIPATVWTAFGTALIAFFGVWITNRNNRLSLKMQLEHNEKMHRQRVTKERLEELYIQVNHWSNAFFTDTLSLTLVMEGHKTYNEYLDILIKEQAKRAKTLDFSRLEMIVEVYGESVQAEFSQVIIARDMINEVQAKHKKAYSKSESGKPFVKLLMEAQETLSTACDNLKMAIAKAARDT